MRDDRELARDFKAEATRIRVPASRRRPPRSRWSRPLAVIGSVAVVVAALALGRAVGELRAGGPAAASATPVPVYTAASPSPTPSPAASTTPSPLVVPSGPLVVGTATGGVFAVGPNGIGDRIFACPGQQAVARVERSPDLRRLFVMCRDASAVGRGHVWEPGAGARAIPLDLIPYASAWSPDGQSLAFLVPGSCAPSAPVCASRVVSYDIRTGQVKTLRDDDVLIENLRWTEAGLTYFRRGTPGGTFLLEGSTWRRISGDLLVARAPDGRLLLDRTLYEAGRERHLVVVLASGQETVLTGPDLSERALGFLPGGHVAALRESASGQTAIVVYAGGTTAASVSAGDFGPIAIEWNGWLVSLTHSNTLAFYSIDARRFASPSVRLTETATTFGVRP